MNSKVLKATFKEHNTDGKQLLDSWNHKEKAHRYKQRLEKTYILERMMKAETKKG
jgi:predicted Ser/Thr protein kinase